MHPSITNFPERRLWAQQVKLHHFYVYAMHKDTLQAEI